MSKTEHTNTHPGPPRSSSRTGDMLALMRADSSPYALRQTQTGWLSASSRCAAGDRVFVLSNLPPSTNFLCVGLPVA